MRGLYHAASWRSHAELGNAATFPLPSYSSNRSVPENLFLSSKPITNWPKVSLNSRSGKSCRAASFKLWCPFIASRITPDKFYKGGSQEKTLLLRPEFFLLPSPPDRARSALSGRAMDSGAGYCGPAVWIFSPSGFHRLFATKPVSSETSKAERWSGASRVGGGARTR